MLPTPEITFINRKQCRFVSIERVFAQVAKSLSMRGVSNSTVSLPFGSGILGIILNLMLFRPPAGNVFHVTGHTHFICLRLPAVRTVLTIHDVRFLGGRPGVKSWLLRKLFLEWPVARAAFVTAPSEKTREDIIRVTGVSSEKVVCVPNPLREEFVIDAPQAPRPNRYRILHVGTMENKNLLRLITALKGLNVELRVVGVLDAGQRKSLERSGIEWLNDESLSSDQMLDAYKAADLLAFCSTFEGFGLPIIEAQAVGLPVVTSNLSPMKEVAGEGALLVDPLDPYSIREGILKLMRDDEAVSALISAGRRNVSRYEPSAIADRYREIYSRLLGNGGRA